MKVVLRARALKDLQSIYAFVLEQDRDAADHFLTSFDDELKLLSAHPFLGRKRYFKQSGIRSWRIRGFEKFLIFYRPTERHLDVIRVLHGARDIAALM